MFLLKHVIGFLKIHTGSLSLAIKFGPVTFILMTNLFLTCYFKLSIYLLYSFFYPLLSCFLLGWEKQGECSSLHFNIPI